MAWMNGYRLRPGMVVGVVLVVLAAIFFLILDEQHRQMSILRIPTRTIDCFYFFVLGIAFYSKIVGAIVAAMYFFLLDEQHKQLFILTIPTTEMRVIECASLVGLNVVLYFLYQRYGVHGDLIALRTFVKDVKKLPFSKRMRVLAPYYLPGAEPTPDRKLYIRPVYHDLYDVIRKEEKKHLFTIEGTPGIGKTMMIPYMIWRLLREQNEPRNIFYCRRDENKYFFKIECKTGAAVMLNEEQFRNAPTEGDYILVDGCVKSYSTIAAVSGIILNIPRVKLEAFISPQKVNREGMGNQSLSRRLMPPWKPHELLDCREKVYNATERAEVLKRFREAGGVVRYVFETPDLDGIDYELSETDISKLVDLEGRIREGKLNTLKFWTVHPWPLDNKEYKFTQLHVKFASTYVQNYALSKWERDRWFSVIGRLWNDVHGVRLGDLFETVCHKIIPQEKAHLAALQLHYYKLDRINTRGSKHPGWRVTMPPEQLTLPRTERSDFDDNYEIRGLIHKAFGMNTYEGVYAKPITGFYPTVDAIVIPNNRGTAPIFLQYTIAEEHTLKMFNVFDAWLNLMGEFRNNYPVFYFVTPDYRRPGSGNDFVPKSPEYSADREEQEKELFWNMTFRTLLIPYQSMRSRVASAVDASGSSAS
eukprot:gb/GECG01000084.1/.p1 GENE.gb/GECG01000084.1/~~gb/GECG01000084.1/.p1  ORF type:complete len:645 (+),score=62.88 gb/GECG01000084.1/:1-1935(+)